MGKICKTIINVLILIFCEKNQFTGIDQHFNILPCNYIYLCVNKTKYEFKM